MSYFKEVYDKLQSDIFEIWMYRTEVETLGGVMGPQEDIIFASAGSFGEQMGLWVTTNERLLCVCKEDHGMAVRGVSYSNIKNVLKDDYVDEQLLGSFTIYFTEGDQIRVSNVQESSIIKMMKEIKERIQEEIVYDVQSEVLFYMHEEEKIINSIQSLYKGNMQYLYLTDEKWMLFHYDNNKKDVVFGALEETFLLETDRQLGQMKWTLHHKEHIGTITFANESEDVIAFKSQIIEQIAKKKTIDSPLPFSSEIHLEKEEEVDDFYTSLTDIECSFLSLFQSSVQIKHHYLFARSHGLMWSSFIDGINEKAIEHLGDILFNEDGEYCVWDEEVYNNRG